MVAKSISTFALGRLPLLLIEERQSLHELDDHITILSEELKQTQSLLEDLDLLQHVDEIIRRHIAQLKEICFDTDNAIEKFIVAGTIKKFGQKKKVVKLIEAVRAKIAELNERVRACGIKARETGESSKGIGEKKLRSKPINPTLTEEFIGRESDIDKLVTHLVEGKESGVISVYGMGGLGKTTLAKKLYQNNDVRGHFKRFTLVHVSVKFEASVVLRQILLELVPQLQERIQDMSNQELLEQLCEVLTEEKCLVVLDDIWTLESDLELVIAAVSKTSSRILITTRNRDVAEIGFCYPLEGLSYEDSWKLFLNKAQPNKDASDTFKEMENIGLDLLEWCKGLPLAILVLGGLLINKHTLAEWKRVHERLNNSDLETKEFSDFNREVASVLCLSYTDLPYRLKPCFLYLANFAIHSVSCYEQVDTSVVACMWIAEGLVLPEDRRDGETLMDVAQRYMDELKIRSLVSYLNQGVSAGNAGVELHDLMWELCVSKATEDGFFSSVVSNDEVINEDATDRLSVNVCHGMAEPMAKIRTGKRLRSLSLFPPLGEDYDYGQLLNDIAHLIHFKYLKVFYIKGFTFNKNKILNGIEKLIHLRVLFFDNCTSIKIPSSLGNLPYVQLLSFASCTGISFPNILWKLKRLVYLCLPSECYVEEKLRLNQLVGLEILDYFCPSFCDSLDISNLVHIKEVSIYITGEDDLLVVVDCLRAVFSKPLRSSTLYWNTICDPGFVLPLLSSCSKLHQLYILGPFSNLAQDHVSFLKNLVSLSLMICGIKRDIMPALGRLPKLEQLSFHDSAFLGEEMVSHASGFPQLKYLNLSKLPNLNKLRIEQGAMPNLSWLKISWCKKLKMIPEGLRYIASLQELDIKGMPEAFVNRLLKMKDKEGEDYDKVRHVPSISIKYTS